MTHGGKREGAGRTRKENNVAMSISVHRDVATKIRTHAKNEKKTLGQVVEVAIIEKYK